MNAEQPTWKVFEDTQGKWCVALGREVVGVYDTREEANEGLLYESQ